MDDSFTVHANQVLDVTAPGLLANDSDADGDALTVSLIDVTGTQGAVVAFPDGHFSFTPTAGFVGDTSFTYTISDGYGGTDVGMVTVHVANVAPVAEDDSFSVRANQVLDVTASGLLANDTDADGDALVVSEVGGLAPGVGLPVSGTYGMLTLAADGSFSYVPNAGSLPSRIVPQDVFTYTVDDGHGGTDEATLTIVVLNPGVSYQAGKDATLTGGNGQDVLDGSAGGNVLLGGNGADVLIGGDGNTMTGGNGPDIFLLRSGFGANTITDFKVSTDALQFSPSIFSDAADVLAHTVDTPGGAVITDDDGNAVTLVGVSLADLQSHTADFYFG